MLEWIKNKFLKKEEFNDGLIKGYRLVFSQTDYKKHRLAGYTEWYMKNDLITSHKGFKYGYFEFKTKGDVILSSKKIKQLKISINESNWFFVESLNSEYPEHTTKLPKPNAVRKYGLIWTPSQIKLYVDDKFVKSISDISTLKYFIDPLNIQTTEECEYINIFQK